MRHLLALTGLLLLLLSAGCGDSKPVANPNPSPKNNSDEKPPEPTADTSEKPPPKPDETEIPPTVSRFDPSREPAADKSVLGQAVSQLSDTDDDLRVAAERKLIDAGAAAIPALLAGLTDKSPGRRWTVAYFLLESFPSSDGRIAAAFRDALGDDDRKVRQLALQAVKRMPPEEMVLAVPKLALLLDSSREEPINRADAVRLLGKMQAEAREALPALIQAAAGDPSEKVRAPALFSITRIAEPTQFLPLLVKALRSDKDAGVRLVAATGLDRLGTAAASALDDLVAALDDRDEKVRRATADALAGLGESALPPLVGKLDSPNPRTREIALYALGRLGPLARQALPAIEKRTQDDDPAVRALAESIAAALRGA